MSFTCQRPAGPSPYPGNTTRNLDDLPAFSTRRRSVLALYDEKPPN